MIQRKNPTLPYADAGPVSAALSANPMTHHACGGKIASQLTKPCWENCPTSAQIVKTPLALHIKRSSRNAQSP